MTPHTPSQSRFKTGLLALLLAGATLLAGTVPVDAAPGGSKKFACSDGADNDGDGKTDYPNDPGCSSAKDNNEYNAPPAACNDGSDNDGDGKTDYPADPGCSSATDTDEYNAPPAACNDGTDNDGDGKTDYPNDPGCSSASDSNERGSTQCDDGSDNDGDGLNNYPADPGCTGPADNNETDPVACNDGLDNDGDGKTDYPADVGCWDALDKDETDPAPMYLYLHEEDRVGGVQGGLLDGFGVTIPLSEGAMDGTPPTSDIPATGIGMEDWDGPELAGYRNARATLTIWAEQTAYVDAFGLYWDPTCIATGTCNPVDWYEAARPLQANLNGVSSGGQTYAKIWMNPVEGTMTPAGTLLVRYEGTSSLFTSNLAMDLRLSVHDNSLASVFHYDSVDMPACLAIGTTASCP